MNSMLFYIQIRMSANLIGWRFLHSTKNEWGMPCEKYRKIDQAAPRMDGCTDTARTNRKTRINSKIDSVS